MAAQVRWVTSTVFLDYANDVLDAGREVQRALHDDATAVTSGWTSEQRFNKARVRAARIQSAISDLRHLATAVLKRHPDDAFDRGPSEECPILEAKWPPGLTDLKIALSDCVGLLRTDEEVRAANEIGGYAIQPLRDVRPAVMRLEAALATHATTEARSIDDSPAIVGARLQTKSNIVPQPHILRGSPTVHLEAAKGVFDALCRLVTTIQAYPPSPWNPDVARTLLDQISESLGTIWTLTSAVVMPAPEDILAGKHAIGAALLASDWPADLTEVREIVAEVAALARATPGPNTWGRAGGCFPVGRLAVVTFPQMEDVLERFRIALAGHLAPAKDHGMDSNLPAAVDAAIDTAWRLVGWIDRIQSFAQHCPADEGDALIEWARKFNADSFLLERQMDDESILGAFGRANNLQVVESCGHIADCYVNITRRVAASVLAVMANALNARAWLDAVTAGQRYDVGNDLPRLPETWPRLSAKVQEALNGFNADRMYVELDLEHRRIAALQAPPAESAQLAEPFLDGQTVVVGKDSIVLQSTEAHVLKSLIELKACSLEQLRKQSGDDSPHTVLKRIAKHSLLAPLIIFPGGKGKGGYRTSIRLKARSP